MIETCPLDLKQGIPMPKTPSPDPAEGAPPAVFQLGDNPSALQIIQEMRGEYDLDDDGNLVTNTDPLPVSVHTKSLSRAKPDPDPLLPASGEPQDPPFAAEIDSLQFALQRLQLAFPVWPPSMSSSGSP
jgi:hypothetical protein